MIVKLISLKQPWANLMVRGIKPVENRKWPTKYRGPLFIHASRTYDFEGHNWIYNHFPSVLRLENYLMGGIIGQVEMVDCVRSYPSPWFFGPWGHVYINAREIPFIPLRGRLGIWEEDIGPIGPI